MIGFKSWALILPALLTYTEAAVRRYTLELNNDIVTPDGVAKRGVIVNHKLPGPLITANKYDQLQVKVINNLNDTTMAQGTSIHWHGIFQHRSAVQDGTAWVTQCPLAAGDSFLYNFTVGSQAGTFWYHSHVTTQYCDGLAGPLVVYDPDDPLKNMYDVDDENTVITIQDWAHLPSPQVLQKFLDPVSHLINGRGRPLNTNSTAALSVVNVEPFKRYRLRVVNAACIAAYNFSIDGHDLTVIETDGIETVPRTVSVVPIHAGQRVSVVVNANQPVGNYWIRAVPWIHGAQQDGSDATGVDAAILRYTGASATEPTTVQTNFNILREEAVMPLVPSNMSHGEPDVKINLNITINKPMGNFSINGHQFIPPTLPVLLQIIGGTVDANKLLPSGSVYTLPPNKLVEVTIPGGSALSPHPFHLHGHAFAVTRSAGSARVNTMNPPLRDVVNTGFSGDNVTFRFRTDNPGPWFIHCHVDYHLDAGLAVVFAEDPKDQSSGPNAEEVTEDWKNLCPKWNSIHTGKQYTIDDPQDYQY
ncbi:hypothetical protein AX15_006218 [Amanita polypyramis BW_CC]|nr:hypothetical protein AX15_006218 [Amanita polypyramis BW_CC]